MNGIFKNNLIFLVFMSVTYSCQIEKEFDYDDTFPESKLAVFALINEENIEVEVRKTLEPLSINSADSVEDIKISLYEDTIYLFDLIKITSYTYRSPENFKPLNTKSYSISVAANEFETVQSSYQSLPQKISIDTCWFKKYSQYTMLYTSFTDPYPEGNGYYLGSILYSKGEEMDGENFIDPLGIFNDLTFDNSQYTTEKEIYIKIYEYDYEKEEILRYTADSAIITLYSLSEEFKKYLESFENYDMSNRSPIYEQPFQIYSNIENGYGFIGAYCIDKYTIIFNNDSI